MASADIPTIHLLGDVRISAGAEPRELPPSRKTRALLAYLALQPRPSRRETLCRLIWDDEPADPRAALRWSLSKLKPLLDSKHGPALVADRSSVELDRTRVNIDLLQVRAVVEAETHAQTDESMHRLERALDAGYLAGLDDVGGPGFHLWVESERDAIRRLHGQLLDTLIGRLSATPAQALALVRKRVALDPLDTPSNMALLRITFEVSGHSRAQETFESVRSRYREERIDDEGLRAAWHALRNARVSVGGGEERAADRDPEDERSAVLVPLPDKPSVAVVGFQQLGAGADGDVLATGLAVDLTSRLSQLPHLFVNAARRREDRQGQSRHGAEKPGDAANRHLPS